VAVEDVHGVAVEDEIGREGEECLSEIDDGNCF